MANVGTGNAPPPQQGQQQGRQRGMMRNPITWVILLGVALAGGAYLLYRRSQANAAASTAAAATPTDSSNQDITQGEAGTLQTEIMDLQSSAAQDEAQETTSSTGGGTSGGGGGGTKAGTPEKVHSTTVTSSSVGIAWDKAPNATAYDVRIAGRGTAANRNKNYVTTRRVAGLSTTFTGLAPDTPYAVDVQALPGGGTGTIRVTTKQAAKRPKGPAPKTQAAHTSKAA